MASAKWRRGCVPSGPDPVPGFYEFFCGGGMARIGLGPDWQCLFANDIDPAKCTSYRANFGTDHLSERDIHDLTADDLPGQATLAWASFPCQDLSLAGNRAGLSGARSGTFWGFHRLMRQLADQTRAPRFIVIENVAGLATSSGGADLRVVAGALADLGYQIDIRLLDAADFLPQSRPRLFIIAWRGVDAGAPVSARSLGLPPLEHAEPALRHLALPPPPRINSDLGTIIQPGLPVFTAEKTEYLLSLMAPLHRARLDAARARATGTGLPVHGALFRRMRRGVQRAEIRFDRAGCLRTPSGGSSKQVLLTAHPGGTVTTRHISGREAARLMGLPDSYRLPASETAALRLTGDGVAVPVVRHIAVHALAPLITKPFIGQLEPAAAGA
ncbi:MAG: DNA cytosine methyltransferase [Pseudomonadota bacterium]